MGSHDVRSRYAGRDNKGTLTVVHLIMLCQNPPTAFMI